jgi:hypothetical protein
VTSKRHSEETFNTIQSALFRAGSNIPQVVGDDLLIQSVTTTADHITNNHLTAAEDPFVPLYDKYVRALQRQTLLPSRFVLCSHDSLPEDLSTLLTPLPVAVTTQTQTTVVTVPNEAPDREELQSLHTGDSEFINLLLAEIQREALKPRTTSSNTSHHDTSRPHEFSVWSTYLRGGQPHAVRVLFPGGLEAAREFYEEKKRQLEKQSCGEFHV